MRGEENVGVLGVVDHNHVRFGVVQTVQSRRICKSVASLFQPRLHAYVDAEDPWRQRGAARPVNVLNGNLRLSVARRPRQGSASKAN